MLPERSVKTGTVLPVIYRWRVAGSGRLSDAAPPPQRRGSGGGCPDGTLRSRSARGLVVGGMPPFALAPRFADRWHCGRRCAWPGCPVISRARLDSAPVFFGGRLALFCAAPTTPQPRSACPARSRGLLPPETGPPALPRRQGGGWSGQTCGAARSWPAALPRRQGSEWSGYRLSGLIRARWMRRLDPCAKPPRRSSFRSKCLIA